MFNLVFFSFTAGVRINLSRVTKADISAKNGVIHEIDNILVPFRYLGQVLVG